MQFHCTQIFILSILILAVPSVQVDWQGTGSMNSTVMGRINTLITNNPITSSSPGDVDIIAQTISTALNDLWDPAWNVVIVLQNKGYDAVVYGYAYNNHWMWINGLPVTGSSTLIWTYIIWKDYNCENWVKFNTVLYQSTFSFDKKVSIGYSFTGYQDRISSDVWSFAKTFADDVYANNRDGAYTVVVSQHDRAQFSGYFCLVNKNLWSVGFNGYGSYLLFMPRVVS